MPDKVNAPAVSQLAGEIARKIHDDYCRRSPSMGKSIMPIWAGIISAALSEREEKVANVKLAWKKLLPHVWETSFDYPGYEHTNYTRAVMAVHAALSALGESKG